MEVFYHRGKTANVGDDLNAVLWDRLLPGLREIDTAEWLVGIGTILDERLNDLKGRRIVMGSGYRPGKHASRLLTHDIHFSAVRGHLTAHHFGLPEDAAVCDPGFLVGRLWAPRERTAQRVGFVPHVYTESRSSIANAVATVGIEVISPSLPVDEFMRKLAACERVYCESLHAAIFADALRVPWARVRLSSHFYEGPRIADFKWRDAFSVLDVPVHAVTSLTLLPVKRSWRRLTAALRVVNALPESAMARVLAAHRHDAGAFRLSNENRLRERTERLLARIEDVRRPIREARRRATGSVCRVLVYPRGGQNPFAEQFARSLESHGAHVDNFDFRRAFLGRYDVVHLHWPESHLRTPSRLRSLLKHARFALACAWWRARGTRIVWMLHNLQPHEGDFRFSAWLFRTWFIASVTHVIALTRSGLEEAGQRYPALRSKPAAIVPHGHYRDAYAAPPPRDVCRRQLNLRPDAFTYVFVGNVRPYKNVPQLIGAFRALDAPDTQLVVAGIPVFGANAEELQALAGSDERIALRLEYVADERLPLYLGAADVVVLPFRSVLNSGSTLLALSFDRRVLAARTGSLPELQAKVGASWLRLYDGDLTPERLQEMRDQPVADYGERPDLSAFEWDAIARSVLTFYVSSAAQPRTVVSSWPV
jgi:beta-1,4-mannosyltransferase